MHADALRRPGDDDDLLMPVLMALALHAVLVALLVFSGWWQPTPAKVSVAGPVVEAALVVSQADVRQAVETAEQAPKPEPVEAAPPPQPLPAPMPEDAPDEPQPTPQEQIPEPDTVEQDAVARLALEREQAREREEQEARRIQEQIDLTAERERQERAERRQRLLAQQEQIRREREEAERQARREQQRLEQLRDAARDEPRPERAPPAPAGGNNGENSDLLAQYVMAMNQVARASWNTSLAPEGVQCKVRFTQIPGGEVVDVQFLQCPFDAVARESVERALRRGHMPYAGFESVFERTINLTFCHPDEACPR